jgi:hypothetical protein
MKIIKPTSIVLLSLLASQASSQTLARETLDSHEHGSASLSIAIDNNLISIHFESPAVNIVGFEYQPNDEEQQSMITEAKNKLSNFDASFELQGESDCLVLRSSANWVSEHDEHSEHGNGTVKTEHDEHSEHKNDTAKTEHDDHSEHKSDTAKTKHDDHSEHKSDTAKTEHDDHSEHKSDAAKTEHDDHSEHKSDTAKTEHDVHSEHENNVVKAEHAEFLVEFELQCEQIDNLNVIDVTLLALFPGINEIDAQIIYPGGQIQQELTIDNTLINLSN